ncbi:hypothetical protein [Falsirhodobacter sp. 1013]|uniref:hypothetical protein n=1 Tax=Falsirhodobacter sp. 1013 TaxID=3417566 RepID=UPI003EBFEE93
MILNGALRAPPKRTFATPVAQYRQSPRYARLAPRTARDYDRVPGLVTQALGDVPVAAFGRRDVLRARDAHTATVRFANHIVQVMRILLEHAIGLGWRPDNPARGVGLLQAEGDPRQAWPPDKIAAFRRAAPF